MLQKLLVIIPCYNEQASLPLLLSELSTLSIPSEYQMEIAIVNDCSEDDTGNIARQHDVTLIDLPVNVGIGGAVQSGLLYAVKNNFDMAVQMDGDGQHPPQEMAKLLNCYKTSGADLIIGSRFIGDDEFKLSYIRRMGIAYFHWLNRKFTGQNIFDSTSGFRLFNKKAMLLAATNYPDEYPEPESLVLFSKAGLIIKEVPVTMRQRNGGLSSIRNFTSLYYCIKVTIAMAFSSIHKI